MCKEMSLHLLSLWFDHIYIGKAYTCGITKANIFIGNREVKMSIHLMNIKHNVFVDHMFCTVLKKQTLMEFKHTCVSVCSAAQAKKKKMHSQLSLQVNVSHCFLLTISKQEVAFLEWSLPIRSMHWHQLYLSVVYSPQGRLKVLSSLLLSGRAFRHTAGNIFVTEAEFEMLRPVSFCKARLHWKDNA